MISEFENYISTLYLNRQERILVYTIHWHCQKRNEGRKGFCTNLSSGNYKQICLLYLVAGFYYRKHYGRATY